MRISPASLSIAMLLTIHQCLVPLGAQSGELSGRRILFSRAGPGEPGEIGVFIANADGTDERPLVASTSLDYNPAWFPDGQWIVFTSERDGSAELYRV